MKPGPKDPTRYTDWGDATLRVKKAPPGDLTLTKYDPNQPRDPAGTATGGQWTGGGGQRKAPTLAGTDRFRAALRRKPNEQKARWEIFLRHDDEHAYDHIDEWEAHGMIEAEGEYDDEGNYIIQLTPEGQRAAGWMKT